MPQYMLSVYWGLIDTSVPGYETQSAVNSVFSPRRANKANLSRSAPAALQSPRRSGSPSPKKNWIDIICSNGKKEEEVIDTFWDSNNPSSILKTDTNFTTTYLSNIITKFHKKTRKRLKFRTNLPTHFLTLWIQNVKISENNLASLPESVLLCVLSFLPAKDLCNSHLICKRFNQLCKKYQDSKLQLIFIEYSWCSRHFNVLFERTWTCERRALSRGSVAGDS